MQGQVTERCLCKTYLIKAEVNEGKKSLHLNAAGHTEEPSSDQNVANMTVISWLPTISN